MRYTYDCEFKEDGKTIDLISIGMVCLDDGREYYAVSNEFDTARVVKDNWLMANVMSSIQYEDFLDSEPVTGRPFKNFRVTDPAAKSREQIARDIVDFLDPWTELWAWYSAYDHVALAQLYGKMIDLPKKVPMMTHDIKTLVRLAGNPPMPRQPAGLHNALEDARQNKVRFEYITKRLEDLTVSKS
jgi:hypothetical protein